MTPATQARLIADAAHEILAGRWFALTDGPAYRAEVTEAAQCAIDGDDYDLRWHIARVEAEEAYRGQYDGDFARWLEGNPIMAIAAESTVPMVLA